MSLRKYPTLTAPLLDACRRNSRGPVTRWGEANVRINASSGRGHSEFFRQSLNLRCWENDALSHLTRSKLNAECPIVGISPEMIENKGSRSGIGGWKRQNEGASGDVYENKGSGKFNCAKCGRLFRAAGARELLEGIAGGDAGETKNEG